MTKEFLDKTTAIIREAADSMAVDTFEITQKEGFANIVTSSDVAVQEFLCSRLSSILPGCGFLCEEEDMNDVAHEYTWIIDPIDGTANYSRGIDQCAICVGLRKDDEIVMGIVFVPRTNEMFTALKGQGAWLNDRSIHVSNRSFENAVLCTALPVYHKEYADVCSRIINKAFKQCNDIRRFGACAPELCYLAMGRCEVYFEYLLSPWDFAAASLILTEAGGCLANLDGLYPDCISPSGLVAANSSANLNKMLGIIQAEISK